jgi:hypothetical protein
MLARAEPRWPCAPALIDAEDSVRELEEGVRSVFDLEAWDFADFPVQGAHGVLAITIRHTPAGMAVIASTRSDARP